MGGYVSGLNDLTEHRGGDPIGFHSLSDIFTVNPDGTIDQNAPSKYTDGNGRPISNQELVGDYVQDPAPSTGRAVYKLGLLDQGEGIRSAQIVSSIFRAPLSCNPYVTSGQPARGRTHRRRRHTGNARSAIVRRLYLHHVIYQAGGSLSAAPGAVIDLSGVSGVLSQPAVNGYAATEVWSNGGTLSIGAGATLAGIDIRAACGNAAQGGHYNSRGLY